MTVAASQAMNMFTPMAGNLQVDSLSLFRPLVTAKKLGPNCVSCREVCWLRRMSRRLRLDLSVITRADEEGSGSRGPAMPCLARPSLVGRGWLLGNASPVAVKALRIWLFASDTVGGHVSEPTPDVPEIHAWHWWSRWPVLPGLVSRSTVFSVNVEPDRLATIKVRLTMAGSFLNRAQRASRRDSLGADSDGKVPASSN
ncbi:hypothetical protein PaG_06623 [Moesziomyces aphidis]|jgi:hypothetical protein|uniref:Uncharacterized protein n=1 Tax=Moesziomyces aphidis TaxID=84754 RepID=W3VDT9_MOEAP|nr:hypothetical protein PaG_06623 [Moesziomyces aphidis]